MGRTTLNNEVLGGLTLMGLAGFYLYFGWGFRFGTPVRMGPGFLPLSLSAILLVMGAVKLAIGLVRGGDEPTWPKLVPALVIAAAPVLFGFLIAPLGVVITVSLVALASRLALRERLRLSDVLISVALGGFCAVVFIVFLGQAMPMWPGM